MSVPSRPVHRASGRASALGHSLLARAARHVLTTQRPRQRQRACSCWLAARQRSASHTVSMHAQQTRSLQPRCRLGGPGSRPERQLQLTQKLPEQTQQKVVRPTEQFAQHQAMAKLRLPQQQLIQQTPQGRGAQWPRGCAMRGVR